MKFAFMQNPLTQIPFFAWIYNSFIISHLLEWLKVRQIKSGIRVNFDQCAEWTLIMRGSGVHEFSATLKQIWAHCVFLKQLGIALKEVGAE